jgi:cytochrome c553
MSWNRIMKKSLLGLIVSLFVLNAAATEDAPASSASCVACHGQSGISSNNIWPNLAGQQRDYLVKEIRAFRDGARVDSGMPAALLQGLTDDQVDELASYFTSLTKATPAPVAVEIPGQNERAYCVSCHGMTGITVSSLWPNLSAQKEGYLNKQLMDYKSGKRQHPIMQVIANELTDEQLADVAKYYSQH